MRTPQQESWSQRVRRLRDIYRFGGPWARAWLVSAPWINAGLIALLLLAVHQRMLVTPGVLFDLPAAPVREGVESSLAALMIPMLREGVGGEETLVFFDDERYRMQDEEQRAALAASLRRRLSLGARRELLLLADKRIAHGDVMAFVHMAREAGAQRINVAGKPE